MVRCPSCGEWNEDDASYCRRCGHELGSPRRSTGLNRLTYDVGAQTLWITRVIAYAVDSFIVGALGVLLSLMAYLPLWVGSVFSGGLDWTGVWRLPFILGAGQVIYFTLMEYMYGASLGKQLLGLSVEASSGGKPSPVAAFMRNATKIYAVALFIDVVMGLALTEDPRDKFTDGVSGAYVVRGGAGPLLRGFRLDLPARRPPEGEWAELRELGERDFLEGIGFGVFLLVVATIAFNYPGIHRVLFNWVRGWGMSGLTPVPGELLPPLYWFFTAMGTWSVISAVIRYYSGWNSWRAAQDLVGGVFNFFMVYMIQRYGTAAFTWNVLFPAFLVFVGAQIVISVFIYSSMRRR
jgi:uncharacterized RDD family membrane protein YckC